MGMMSSRVERTRPVIRYMGHLAQALPIADTPRPLTLRICFLLLSKKGLSLGWNTTKDGLKVQPPVPDEVRKVRSFS